MRGRSKRSETEDTARRGDSTEAAVAGTDGGSPADAEASPPGGEGTGGPAAGAAAPGGTGPDSAGSGTGPDSAGSGTGPDSAGSGTGLAQPAGSDAGAPGPAASGAAGTDAGTPATSGTAGTVAPSGAEPDDAEVLLDPQGGDGGSTGTGARAMGTATAPHPGSGPGGGQPGSAQPAGPPGAGRRADEAQPSGGAGPGAGAATENHLGAELGALRGKVDELTLDVQRVTADYANYRRRVERDKGLITDQAIGTVLAALLPVLDDLDRARDHGDLVGPFGSVAEQLVATLGKFGLTSFGEKGDAFDPTRHEAVAHQTSEDVTEATCVDILRRGYMMGDRLLRAALVAVADPQ